jgi:hypothetical protein
MKNWTRAFVMAAYPVLLVGSTTDAFTQEQGGVRAMQSLEQVEQFLRTADVVGMENYPPGKTGLQKVALAQGETVRHAVFTGAGFPPDLRDFWKLEIAAYEVDKLLGLSMVPPTVERVVRGTRGSLQLWIENAMSEAERLEKKIDPPDVEVWRRQIWKVRVFDQLVYNADRNLGNLLYDKNWKVYMVGNDRTFQATSDLMNPRNLTHISVSMMEALKKLSKANLTRSCSGYLSGPEIDALLARRDKILEVHKPVVAVRRPIGILPLKVNGK